uniref:ZZ-type domain-containing protein n=1 Tax=Trichobilharzia regenti TaxID=157069 RepID=A0AA85KAX9_TRIRE|nr:unnamed protein product [Trichobilharzia regenti]
MLVKFIFPSLRSDNNLEVCRIQYYGSPKSLNLEWIAKAIFKITNLKRDTVFSLYYYGVDEFVQIISKSCIKRMVKNFCNHNQICRIYAVPHPYKDKKCLNSFFSYCKADDLPNILLNPPIVEVIDQVWLDTPCKLCDKVNWLDERYTCLFCTNIVLCRECFYTNYHNEHPMLCTRNTKLFSQKLLQLSRLAVASVPWNNNVLPRITNNNNNNNNNNNGNGNNNNSNNGADYNQSINPSINITKQTKDIEYIVQRREHHNNNNSKRQKLKLKLFKKLN